MLMAAGLGKGRRQVCSAAAQGRALPAREKGKKWCLPMTEQGLQGEGGCGNPRLSGSLYTLSRQSPYI